MPEAPVEKPGKYQPWRQHWPPAAKKVNGVEYATAKGDEIIMDGTSAGSSGAALVNYDPEVKKPATK